MHYEVSADDTGPPRSRLKRREQRDGNAGMRDDDLFAVTNSSQ
jgi:hypothetical protein